MSHRDAEMRGPRKAVVTDIDAHHDEGDEAEGGERDDEARALDVAAIAP